MTRSEKLALLNKSSGPDHRFDVLILGGGATGLGIAVDAVTRGFRTALVEAGDFAQATSSRSTKLVHGGVRYLASGQVHLVYEALHERAVLLRNAPHLVRPQPFLTPAYHWHELPFYGVGLKLYDFISGSSSLGPTRLLSRAQVLARLPGIAPAGLKGGILYHDGQFDDARLALALALTAEDHGACTLNYVRSRSLLKTDGRLSGALVEDTETGTRIPVHANLVINATGIFVDQIRHQDNPTLPNLLSASRGTHIVVAAEVLSGRAANPNPNTTSPDPKTAIMVPKTDDGRIIFAIPWLGKVVIGTTDIPTSSVEMEPGHQAAEIDFLLETINPFLARPLTQADILSIFSGLRPLVTGSAGKTSKLSREHHIDVSPTGLITVAGGKWTTYRRMAQDTLDFAARSNLLPSRPCRTDSLRLHGAPFHAGQGSLAPDTLDPQRPSSAPKPTLAGQGTLAHYGSDAPHIKRLIAADPSLAQPLDPDLPYTAAEVVFAVRHEMARTVEDVLSRRTRALLLDAAAALRAAPTVARLMAAELAPQLASAQLTQEAWIHQQLTAFDHLARTFYLHPQAAPGPPIS